MSEPADAPGTWGHTYGGPPPQLKLNIQLYLPSVPILTYPGSYLSGLPSHFA